MESKMIGIVMDRPIGTPHPKHPEMIYPINYGYIEGLIAPDGEEQDVYLLGVEVPLERYIGKLIAVVHRNDDVEDKWVACPADMTFTAEEIMTAIHFQEQFYDSYVEMLVDNTTRIFYADDKKDLPSEQLRQLFMSARWSDGKETEDMRMHFNAPFINSTLVISAWDNDCLIGAVRVLSDKIIRSVIYDVIVDPKFHNMGIGQELIKRCIEHFPNTEWLVQTTHKISSYYEKLGFTRIDEDVFLNIPSKYF